MAKLFAFCTGLDIRVDQFKGCCLAQCETLGTLRVGCYFGNIQYDIGLIFYETFLTDK